MFIILDIRYSLCKVAVGADSRGVEAVLDFTKELFNHWDSVLTDNDTLHFKGFDLTIPLVVSSRLGILLSRSWFGKLKRQGSGLAINLPLGMVAVL